MAYSAKKYKKEETVRVDKIKLEAVEAVEEKEKATKTTEKETAAIKEVDGVRPANPDQNVYVASGVDTYSQQGLTDLGIYLPIETTSQEEIQRIIETIEVAPATPVVNFNLNYDIELIPVPDINTIYSLTTIEGSVWNKPIYGLDESEGEVKETHVLKNFVKQNGGRFHICVTGTHNTCFKLAIYNKTNNTYYNWSVVNVVKEDTGVNSSSEVATAIVSDVAGVFNHGVTYFEGVIPEEGKETIAINIPVATEETVYEVGFIPDYKSDKLNRTYGGFTNYNNSLPMFDTKEEEGYTPLYRITQLMRSSTTIKLDDNSSDKGLIVKHTPGSILNSSNATKGKYSIDLNFTSRHSIVLNENVPSGILDISHLQFSDDPSQITEVLNVDLVASISEGVGNITGTLTLGKASLRPSTINIRANEIFLTEQDNA